jgi:hypothetical protein
MRLLPGLACLGLVTGTLACHSLRGQTPGEQQLQAQTTIHVDASLTLVDVIAEETKDAQHSRQLLKDLKSEDFRLFDNGHEMPIRTLDSGWTATTHPIALWLIVQCNMGFPVEWASTFMRGKTQMLEPALKHLNKDDLVGVAHWCDTGSAKIDLPPSRNIDAALAKVNDEIDSGVELGNIRDGQRAMQRMIRMVLADTHKATGDRLPILLFLYGDHHNAAPAKEAEAILEDLLQTSGIVFGLNDEDFKYDPLEQQMAGGGLTWHLVHYYSQETGGQYYSSSHPELFSAALDYILTQVHSRYVLGFRPPILDGKRHTLRVELSKDARQRYGAPLLRFRTEYIPAPPSESH